MNIFIYITGIASLLGLVLQLKDVFPKYRNLRKNMLLVVLGAFVGTLLGGIRLVEVTLSAKSNLIEILALVSCICLCIIIGILVIGMIFVKGNERPFALGVSIFMISIVFLLTVLMVTGIEPKKHEVISLDELKSLVDIHEKNKNYDRSIYLLESMKSMVRNDNTRLELINNRLESLKKKQLTDVADEDNE